MTDRELMQQALEALTAYDGTNGASQRKRVLAALRERLAQPEMQPCAGRNCGSTNPNLHSAECFEDYEQATGMNQWQGLTGEEVKAPIQRAMHSSWVQWDNTVCNPLAPAREQTQSAWQHGYESGFVDGMSRQAQSSVDKAVNAMCRKWQGLTADEIWDAWCEQAKPERDTKNFVAAFARVVEAKLKEKNHG